MPRKTDGIEFEIHPRPTKGEDGKPLLYVRPAKGRKKSFKDLEAFCNKYRGLRTGELQQVMDVVMEVVGLWLSYGYRIETPLGSFAPKLKLMGEHTDPKTIHGRDVRYAGIEFIPSKEFVKEGGQNREGYRKSQEPVGNSQIHIHKDEGHYTNPDDPSTWQPNLHAHIIWDWMNHETGKSFKLGKKDMEELQDMAAETLEMERGKRKSETGAEHLERNDYIIQKQEEEKKKNHVEIEKQKKEIADMAQASILDKLLHSGLSPAVRKAIEEERTIHKEELRQATTAVDENGYPYVWTSGNKKDQPVTWEELAKVREKEKKKAEIQAKEDKDAALAKAKADKEAAVAKAKAEAKAEHDAEIAEMKKVHAGLIDKERYATNEKGNTIYWSGGSKDGQKVTKDERIKWLGDQLKESEEANNALCERLKDLRELIFAACSLNFKKVVQIIVDQWKAGLRQFTKDLKDFLLKAMSVEKTTEGRKTYVNDAFDFAKMLAKTDPDLELDDKALKPLYDDALKIADGTWESYHQKRDQLFDAAVIALVEMGNCQNQRHLNQKQVDAIEAFISQDGGDRDMLCVDLWDAASPKVDYYWRNGTFDALEELRTRELNHRTYGNSRGL